MEVNWNKIKQRFEWVPKVPKRKKTGLEGFDAVFGGLPPGMTLFIGKPGTGKSLMCKAIASKFGENAVYIVAERPDDYFTVKKINPKIKVANYLQARPRWDKAILHVQEIYKRMKPEIIIIDSFTQFFSNTPKAVEEADLRVAADELVSTIECPVVATSQIRGNGYPAGGWGVVHAATMVIEFNKIHISSKWEAKRYGAEEGEFVFTVRTWKDAFGLEGQGVEYIVTYPKLSEEPEVNSRAISEVRLVCVTDVSKEE